MFTSMRESWILWKVKWEWVELRAREFEVEEYIKTCSHRSFWLDKYKLYNGWQSAHFKEANKQNNNILNERFVNWSVYCYATVRHLKQGRKEAKVVWAKNDMHENWRKHISRTSSILESSKFTKRKRAQNYPTILIDWAIWWFYVLCGVDDSILRIQLAKLRSALWPHVFACNHRVVTLIWLRISGNHYVIFRDEHRSYRLNYVAFRILLANWIIEVRTSEYSSFVIIWFVIDFHYTLFSLRIRNRIHVPVLCDVWLNISAAMHGYAFAPPCNRVFISILHYGEVLILLNKIQIVYIPCIVILFFYFWITVSWIYTSIHHVPYEFSSPWSAT